MREDFDVCPTCGALPCDWADRPVVKQSLTTAATVKERLTVQPVSPRYKLPDPNCRMCDGQGFKDHAGFCMDPCDCARPT